MRSAATKSFLIGIALTAVAVAVRADSEAPNTAHVAASEYGRCYVKSVPDDWHGQKGTTRVYQVGAAEDTLLHTFDWFSQRIHIECFVSPPSGPVQTAVVRFGPWARGHQANDRQLALAFYFGGELKRRYSTLDIAGTPDNVSRSVSHYTVIEAVDGFRWLGSANRYEFVVRTSDGRTLRFDPSTGEQTSPP